jgi:hypothetical protein
MDRAGPAALRPAVHRAALDGEGGALDQGPGHRPASLGEHPAEGGPGDAHPAGGLLVVEALQVGQAQGLEPVQGHPVALEAGEGDPRRLEDPGAEGGVDASAASGSGHDGSSFQK